jgi:hypothetical protein
MRWIFTSPKLAKRAADETYLTLSETLREPVSYCHSLRHLGVQDGIVLEDNDPELIRDAVAEMLTRLDGGSSSDADVADVRVRADRIYQSHGRFGMAKLARVSAPVWRPDWLITAIHKMRLANTTGRAA